MSIQIVITALELNSESKEVLKELLGISEFELDSIAQNLPSRILEVDTQEEADQIIKELNAVNVSAHTEVTENELSLVDEEDEELELSLADDDYVKEEPKKEPVKEKKPEAPVEEELGLSLSDDVVVLEAPKKETKAPEKKVVEEDDEDSFDLALDMDDEDDLMNSSPARSAPPSVYDLQKADTKVSDDSPLGNEIDSLINSLNSSPLKKEDSYIVSSLKDIAEAKKEAAREAVKSLENGEVSPADAAKPATPEPKVKKSIPYLAEAIVALIFIAAFIGLYKLIMNKDSIDQEKKAYKEYVDTVFDVAKNKHVQVVSPEDNLPADTFMTFTVGDFPNGKVFGIFNLVNGKLSTYDLVILGEEPSALTDLQIVNGERQKPWLKKVNLSNMSIVNKDNGFSINGLAKVVIINNDRPVLINTNAIVTGEIRNNNQIELKVLVNKGYDQLPTQDFMFESISPTESKIFLKKEIKVGLSPSEDSVSGIEQKLSELAD